MNFATANSEMLAKLALQADGRTHEDCPHLAQVIGEFLQHHPHSRIHQDGDTFFVCATGSNEPFVYGFDKTAIGAWFDAHDSYTPCEVLD